jgi:hypothetical protein
LKAANIIASTDWARSRAWTWDYIYAQHDRLLWRVYGAARRRPPLSR